MRLMRYELSAGRGVAEGACYLLLWRLMSCSSRLFMFFMIYLAYSSTWQDILLMCFLYSFFAAGRQRRMAGMQKSGQVAGGSPSARERARRRRRAAQVRGAPSARHVLSTCMEWNEFATSMSPPVARAAAARCATFSGLFVRQMPLFSATQHAACHSSATT